MTEPTTQTLIELRKLADAATPGATHVGFHNKIGDPLRGSGWQDDLVPVTHVCSSANGAVLAFVPREVDCDFYAAANPAKVIELLDALEAQAREIDGGKKDQRENLSNQCELQAEVNTLKAELVAIRAQEPVEIVWQMRTRLGGREWSRWGECADRNLNDPRQQSAGPMDMEFRPLYTSPVVDVNAGLVELPKEDTEEANKAITSMLAEYQYPANPQNAGRAGWRAARLYTAHTQQAPKGGE